jgi:hypothetical protein
MFYVSTKLFQENPTFYMVYLKIIKFGTKICLSTTSFLSFLHRSKKEYVFLDTLLAVECGDIHAYIFFLKYSTF